MAEFFDELDDKLSDFIRRQAMFFVGTAGAQGTVNVSPKGMDTLRVVDENTIIWLNLTGSGNETAAHVQELPRMTLMFCEFTGEARIIRTYGTAEVLHGHDDETWKI